VYGANKQWWNLMLEEAEGEGLIKVTNLNLKKKELKSSSLAIRKTVNC
jgi:hypothetical protein